MTWVSQQSVEKAQSVAKNNSSRPTIKKPFRHNLPSRANPSTGGDAIDVTEHIHKDFKGLAVGITRDMGLRMCGVDIITSHDIRTRLSDYVIIEINSAPGLDNYASIGNKQKRRVEQLYVKVLKALSRP